MTRLPPADPQADPALAAVYTKITQTRGFVSNALGAIGHAPEGLKHLARLGASLSATYYRALGTMVMAFRVEMESTEVLGKEKAWQKVHVESQQ